MSFGKTSTKRKNGTNIGVWFIHVNWISHVKESVVCSIVHVVCGIMLFWFQESILSHVWIIISSVYTKENKQNKTLKKRILCCKRNLFMLNKK